MSVSQRLLGHGRRKKAEIDPQVEFDLCKQSLSGLAPSLGQCKHLSEFI